MQKNYTKRFLSIKNLMLFFVAFFVLLSSFAHADYDLHFYNGNTSASFSCNTLYAGEATASLNNQRVFKVELDKADGTTVPVTPIYQPGATSGIGEPVATIALGPFGKGGPMTMFNWYWGSAYKVHYVQQGETSKFKELVPNPPPGLTGAWSGGEVFQETGEIYFAGLNGRRFSTNYDFMKYDPATGSQIKSGKITPLTASDNYLDTWIVSSDMAIDADGDIYVLVGDGGSRQGRTIVKVSTTNNTGDWKYSVVTKLKRSPSGEIWGMAFLNGLLYFTSETNNRTLWAANTMTGDAWKLGEMKPTQGNTGGRPNSNPNASITYMDDLAACQTAPVIKGKIYHDAGGQGNNADFAAMPNMDVEIWKDEGGVPQYKSTIKTNGIGEYNFIVDSTDNDYYIRFPNLTVDSKPAVQNWAQAGSFGATNVVAQCYNPATNQLEDNHTTGGCLSRTSDDKPGEGSPLTWASYQRVEVRTDTYVPQASIALTTVSNYGDAPSAYGNPAHYSPGAGGDSANNEAMNILRLGERVSIQSGPQPSPEANKILTHDGVEVAIQGSNYYQPLQDFVFVAGAKYTLRVAVNGSAANQAYLGAWLDWNGSNITNSFSASNQIIANGTLTSGNEITFDYEPSGTVQALTSTYARFRVSTLKDIDATEMSQKDEIIFGEVEDYRVYLVPGDLTISTMTNGGVGSFDYAFDNISSNLPSSNKTTVETLTEGVEVFADTRHVFERINQPITITQTTLDKRFWLENVSCKVNGTEIANIEIKDNDQVVIPANAVTNGSQISCQFTNSAGPRLELIKTIVERDKVDDQFTIQIKEGATVIESATTTGSALEAKTAPVRLKHNQKYTLTEVMANADTQQLARYTTAISCHHNLTGSTTPLPSGDGKSFDITPMNGDHIICTLTNNAVKASANDSIIKAVPISIAANELEESLITVTVRDANGDDLGVGGDIVRIFFTDKNNHVGEIVGDTASEGNIIAKDQGDGTYSIKVRSKKAFTEESFSYTVNDKAGKGVALVSYTSGQPSGLTSKIEADPESITADGQVTSILTVQLYDENHNKIEVGKDPETGENYEITIIAIDESNPVGTLSATQNKQDGSFTATVTSTLAGTETFGFKIKDSVAIGPNAKASIAYTAGEPSGLRSTIASDPKLITANGDDYSTLTVQLYDINGNKITTGTNAETNQPYEIEIVHADFSNKFGEDVSATQNLNDGSFIATVQSSRSGTDLFTFKVAGVLADSSNPKGTDFVEYSTGSGEFDDKTSTIKVTPNTIAADGKSTATVTVKMFYASNPSKPLADYKGLSLISADPNVDFIGNVNQNYSEPQPGIYEFIITSTTQLGKDAISFRTAAKPSTKQDTLTYVAGRPSGQLSSIVANPKVIIANGSDISTLTVQLYDENGNKITTGADPITNEVYDINIIHADVMNQYGDDVSNTINHHDGTFSATVQSTKIGIDTFTFEISGVQVDNSNPQGKDTVEYSTGDGKFDDQASTIQAEPNEIDADGKSTSTVTVKMFYESNPSKPLAGYKDLKLISATNEKLMGVVNPTYTEPEPGVYKFIVTSTTTLGTDTFTFRTAAKPSTKSDTVKYSAGKGVFDDVTSTIQSDPAIIDADGQSTSIVTVMMFYESDPSKPLTGYEGLKLVSKTGTAFIGHVNQNYTESEAGVYRFTITSTEKLGTDTFSFETKAKPSSKSTTVEYRAGGDFDETASTIKADPNEIEADGKSVSTMTVKMFYKSDPSKPLAGYKDLVLVSATGKDFLGEVDQRYTEPDPGVYEFVVTSTSKLGTDTFSFKTNVKPSTATDTLEYGAGKGIFDDASSTIEAKPNKIDADGKSTSIVTVKMFYESNPSEPLAGYKNLKLISATGDDLIGKVNPNFTESKPGVYEFIVTSTTQLGIDTISFETEAKPSTKRDTIEYDAGRGVFDEVASTITVDKSEIDADGVDTATVTVKMFYESDPTKPIVGYKDLVLVRKDGLTPIGKVVFDGEKIDGEYSFKVTSTKLGYDNFAFKTEAKTSNKSVKIDYVAGGDFDQASSTIEANPIMIDADGLEASTVVVKMFYSTDNTKPITGHTPSTLKLISAKGTAIGIYTPSEIFESAPGEYQFEVTSLLEGDEDWKFETKTQISDKSTNIEYLKVEDALLLIRLTASNAQLKVGDVVMITANVKNIGNVPASAFNIINSLPGGFSYVANSAKAESTNGKMSITGNSPLDLGNLELAAGSEVNIRFVVRIGAGIKPGNNTLYAEAFMDKQFVTRAVETRSISISNKASLILNVADSDPLFDDSLIIGTVYHDRNGNGMQDPGEPGIPGVRIASAEGLIITTDQFGRYHLKDIKGGKWERGRNYILKIDKASLPEGVTFVTPNPLVRRITPGLPTRFDFAVQLPEESILEISEALFVKHKVDIKPEYERYIDQMIELIEKRDIKEITISVEKLGALSEEREAYLQERLNSQLNDEKQIILGSESQEVEGK